MKKKLRGKAFTLFLTAMTVFTVSCSASPSGTTPDDASSGPQDSASLAENSQEESSGSDGAGRDNPLKSDAAAQSQIVSFDNFAEAHDAFTTTLAREENDNDTIPDPPEGLFDLVTYPSKVGDLAAYVSSDPGDGEKHPLIIWVVGGWGNGIDDFPWCYPEWDNDQTGSAFWQAGLLTMYPSFRGGNGNPGYYEALFGEVDDIVAAYEYAASLPYVDPERIYLGGHSTGGTRALLASEYTDKFRAVFCFGAVDEVKYHNNSQFTFDTDNEDEYTMRSPIHWLDNIKSPTFLIEGRDGNSANLERMQAASQNENLHCYVIEGADHFSTLAPTTRLVAQKILADTGAAPDISITQEELDQAMAQEPPIPMPVMTTWTLDWLDLTFSCPYLWEVAETSDDGQLTIYSRYEDSNAWDMSVLYLSGFTLPEGGSLQGLRDHLSGFDVTETTIDDRPALDCLAMQRDEDGETFYERYVVIQNGEVYVEFDYLIHDSFMDEAVPLFQSILDSIAFVAAE